MSLAYDLLNTAYLICQNRKIGVVTVTILLNPHNTLCMTCDASYIYSGNNINCGHFKFVCECFKNKKTKGVVKGTFIPI